jgi:exopolyphosphatase/guanosine-5'-triphosphate,3'-diphosphate pyrophosphatase
LRYSDHRAIIDIGSNSVRINIMGISKEGHFMLVDQAREKTRISAGMGEDKMIRPEAIERLLDTLQSFEQIMQVYQVSDVQALATAAIRQANNQQDVLQIVERKTPFSLTVLSEEEEATLGFLGSVNSLNESDALLVDLGGASTEFVLMRKRQMVQWGSIPYGAVTLSEKFANDRGAAISFIRSQLEKVDWLDEAKGLPVIGLGGSIRTLAKIDQIRRNWPLDNLHGYSVSAKNTAKYLDEISRAVGARIRRMRGVSSTRADILRIGIVPFEVIFERIAAPFVRISIQGIREGAFYREYLKLNGHHPILSDVADFSGKNLQRRMGVSEEHASYIEWLFLELYDQLEKDKLPGERRLLQMAARLHDIGMGVGYFTHHQHGLYLALHAGLLGFYEEERMFIALLIGLHRNRSLGRFSRPYSQWLGRDMMQRIERLGVLLSLAERLDRTESKTVESIEVTEQALLVKLKNAYRKNLLEISIESLRRPFAAKYEKEIILLR